MSPQCVSSREKCFVNSAAAAIHTAMSLRFLPSPVSFMSPLTLFKLIDTRTQFWLLRYNMNPHMAPEWSFYCHGPFSPLKNTSDILAGTAPTSHYLGLDPMPARFSSVSCKVILHGTESPSGGSNSVYNSLPLTAHALCFCTDNRGLCFWKWQAQRSSLQPSCGSLHSHTQEPG